MLTAINLGNFKAFESSQHVPVRPLTLIFGANSSGKSSLLHGLLWAAHIADTGDFEAHRMEIAGDSVDLGGFAQYVHRHDQSRRVEWAAELDAGRLGAPLADWFSPVKRIAVIVTVGIEVDDLGKAARGSAPSVWSYDLEADGLPLLRFSRRRDDRLHLDALEQDHPFFRGFLNAVVESSSTTAGVRSEDLAVVAAAVDETVAAIAVSMDGLFPRRTPRTGVDVLQPISRGNRAEDIARTVRLALPRHLYDLLDEIASATSDALRQTQYLGPLRSYPPRHIAFTQHQDPNWRAGGGYAWDVLRSDPEVRGKVNRWLSSSWLQTPYEITVRELVSLSDIGVPIEDALFELFDEAAPDDEGEATDPDALPRLFDPEATNALLMSQIENADLERVRELVLVDLRSNTTVSHRDVGIGVSQVLPVLVGCFASKERIIAIEQPEIHLHPALQAELGDVFIQSALGGQQNRFLLETHSEHLILRVMRRMRDTASGSLPEGLPPVTPKDVAILFVEPAGSSSVVRELALDEQGRLLDPWPGGFFEEGFRERFA